MIDSNTYTTQFTYDGADRLATVTYPTGEVVTQGYSQRGLPHSLSGTVAGSLVTGTSYNGLGGIVAINLGNSKSMNYGYWGVGGSYDTSGGYYGRLWRVRTSDQSNPSTGVIQQVRHTWDAAGNLTERVDDVGSETETFSYDSLDRLTAVSGAYSETYAYNAIGNITSRNGNTYVYGSSRPHAVTFTSGNGYVYDNNGNMTSRGGQTITWDVENRPTAIAGGAPFVYDGDGKRVKKTENGETTVYVNRYYEKNVTTSEVTTHYLGAKEIALRKSGTVSYLSQDHLTGTSVISNTSGASTGTIRYLPFGETRSTSGTIPTDKKFTGQRLDGTGLYYYNARYYDPGLGRFISPDTIVPNFSNPQSLNRYSYVRNNPLRYTDEDGHGFPAVIAIAALIGAGVNTGFYALQVSRNENMSFTWGGLAQAVASGAVAGALSVIAPHYVAGTGAAGVAVTLAAGGASAVEGYLAGEATETVVSGLAGQPDLSTPSLENTGTAFTLGVFATAAGRLAAGGGLGALKNVAPISSTPRTAYWTAAGEGLASTGTYGAANLAVGCVSSRGDDSYGASTSSPASQGTSSSGFDWGYDQWGYPEWDYGYWGYES